MRGVVLRVVVFGVVLLSSCVCDLFLFLPTEPRLGSAIRIQTSRDLVDR